MNKSFWRACGIRAVKTTCQTAAAMIPAAAMIHEVDWIVVVSTAALAGLTSVLTSMAAGLPEVDNA